ncbi:cruciform cutting endonuclease Cce1 [Colletotrichum sp. SAR11_59]|nr:cruciform cutting endonuclease Cce1 [Colletotrichum sp. SAR11_59]
MTSAPDGAYAERRIPDYDSYPPKSEMPLDQLITTFLQTLLVQSSVLDNNHVSGRRSVGPTMQDFIDVVILYNEDFVKAGNEWVRDFECLPWSASTTVPLVIRHPDYVDAKQENREKDHKHRAKQEHKKAEKSYIAWSNRKEALENSNNAAELAAHMQSQPAHGLTKDQRYQILRAGAAPPINRAPTTQPVAPVWTINTIGDLLHASEEAQREVDNEYNALVEDLLADNITFAERRSNDQIAQQGPDELAMWLVFNSESELQMLRNAAATSVDAVKRHLTTDRNSQAIHRGRRGDRKKEDAKNPEKAKEQEQSIKQDDTEKTRSDKKRPPKPPIRVGVCDHIVQSFVAKKDNKGRLVLVQACLALSCKLSLRRKEAMDLPEKVLVGQFLHFDTGKRIANPTSYAEVPMSKFCGMVLRDPLNKPW